MNIEEFLKPHSHVFIKQVKEWGEIIFNFETINKYELFSQTGSLIGCLQEEGSGIIHFLKRTLFRSHRALEIRVSDAQNQTLLTLKRDFFFFFSDLRIINDQGTTLGFVHRKFGIISKKYELCDANQIPFAFISAGLFKIWTFKINDSTGREIAEISKKWGGLLKEAFTDADQFGISFGEVTGSRRAVLLGAAISIDFDFFEDNSRNHN